MPFSLASAVMPLAPELRADGQLFAVGGGVFVCRYPLSTALPIPLAVRTSGAPELVTWAFAGLAGGAEPSCLLVLAYPEGAAAPAAAITVETHFHDLSVEYPPPCPLDDLITHEREALCAAVLAAVTPRTFAVLSRFLPAFADVMVDWAPDADAPELAIATDRDGTARLSGTRVPDYLLLRAGEVWSCARVVSAHLRFGRAHHAILDLKPAWGTPAGAPPDRAILIGNAAAMSAGLAA